MATQRMTQTALVRSLAEVGEVSNKQARAVLECIAARYRGNPLQAAPDREPMMDFPGQAAEGSAGPVYGATYYPGTASKDRATALTVEAGREAAGIDIRLEATRTFRMSGVVTGAPAAASGAAMVWVSPAPRGHGVFIGSNGFPIGPGGKFTITGLAPGRYRVMARSEDVLTSPALQSPSVEVSLETGDLWIFRQPTTT